MANHARFQPKSSYRVLVTLCLTHIVALSVVWLTDIGWLAGSLFTLAILLSLLIYLRHPIKLLPSRLVRDFSLAEDNITVFAGDEIAWAGKVLPQTVVTPYFVLLCAKSQQSGAKYHQLICSDALSEGEFRKLRTTLKFSQ